MHNPTFYLNRYEKVFERSCFSNPLFGSQLAGISKAIRLSKSFSSSHQQTIWDTGANVVAPVIFFFVWWVLNRAKANGITKLCFASRDGRILFDAAKIIQDQWKYDIDCVYLHISRQSLLSGMLIDIDEVALSWILESTRMDPLTPEILASRLGLASSDLKKYVNNIDHLPTDIPFNKHELKSLERSVKSKEFSEKFRLKGESSLENLVGYLNQIGLSKRTKFALVDSGWTGRSLYALSKLLDLTNNRHLEGILGLFLGCGKSTFLYKNDKLESFLITPHIKQSYSILVSPIIEILLASSEGRSLGYRKEGSSYKPVLASESDEYALQWGISIQHESILKFCELLSQHLTCEDFSEEVVKNLAFKLWKQFILTPSFNEAKSFGQFCFDSEMVEFGLGEAAPKLTFVQFLHNIFFSKRMNKILWPSGTFARSDLKFLGFLYKLYRKLKYF